MGYLQLRSSRSCKTVLMNYDYFVPMSIFYEILSSYFLELYFFLSGELAIEKALGVLVILELLILGVYSIGCSSIFYNYSCNGYFLGGATLTYAFFYVFTYGFVYTFIYCFYGSLCYGGLLQILGYGLISTYFFNLLSAYSILFGYAFYCTLDFLTDCLLGLYSYYASPSSKSGFQKTLAFFLSSVFFSSTGGAGELVTLVYFFSGEPPTSLFFFCGLEADFLGEAFLILSQYSMSCFQKLAILAVAVFMIHSFGTNFPLSCTVNLIVIISSAISTEYRFFMGIFTFASSMLSLLGESFIFTLLKYPKKTPWTTMKSRSLNLSPLQFYFQTTLIETRFSPISTDIISVRAFTIVCYI